MASVPPLSNDPDGPTGDHHINENETKNVIYNVVQ